MAEDRPSWSEIDKMRDRPGGRRNRREENKTGLRQHSTRYERYKADLDRLFDQGMVGELLKQPGKKSEQPKSAPGKKGKVAVATRVKKAGRITKDDGVATSRLKLIRAVIDARSSAEVIEALDELVSNFGMQDDWDVLVRVVEHPDEKLVLRAVNRMKELLPSTTKIPRRFTLKERLRTIGQTARDAELRRQAESLEERI